jgi:hypothetical protein
MKKPYKSYGVMGTMFSKVCMRYRNTEVLRDHVRFVFNRTEGKQEIVVLKEYESVRMVSKPFAQIYSFAIGQLR